MNPTDDGQDSPPRTYFGADDPPEEDLRPAVPKGALVGLLLLFILVPLLILGGLIATGGPERPGRDRPADGQTDEAPK